MNQNQIEFLGFQQKLIDPVHRRWFQGQRRSMGTPDDGGEMNWKKGDERRWKGGDRLGKTGVRLGGFYIER